MSIVGMSDSFGIPMVIPGKPITIIDVVNKSMRMSNICIVFLSCSNASESCVTFVAD